MLQFETWSWVIYFPTRESPSLLILNQCDDSWELTHSLKQAWHFGLWYIEQGYEAQGFI